MISSVGGRKGRRVSKEERRGKGGREREERKEEKLIGIERRTEPFPKVVMTRIEEATMLLEKKK